MMISNGMILMNWEFFTEFSCRYLKLISSLNNVEYSEDDNGQSCFDCDENDEKSVELVHVSQNLLLNVFDIDV